MDKHVLPKIGGIPVDQTGSAAVYEALRRSLPKRGAGLKHHDALR